MLSFVTEGLVHYYEYRQNTQKETKEIEDEENTNMCTHWPRMEKSGQH